MNAPTNSIQIIEKNGKPMFAVLPYEDYLAMLPKKDEKTTIPHEVVGLVLKEGMNLVKAWRKHLGLTQKEVAKSAGITHAAVGRTAERLRLTVFGYIFRQIGLTDSYRLGYPRPHRRKHAGPYQPANRTARNCKAPGCLPHAQKLGCIGDRIRRAVGNPGLFRRGFQHGAFEGHNFVQVFFPFSI